MQPIVRFVGRVEPNEMYGAYKLAWRSTWQMWFRRLFFLVLGSLAVVMGAIGFVASKNNDASQVTRAVIYTVAIVAFLASNEYSLRRRVTRALKASVFNDETGEARIEKSGVVFEDPQAKLQLAWDKSEGFRVTDEIVVYYIGYPRTFLAFFRRLAATKDDWDRFLEVTRQHLSPR